MPVLDARQESIDVAPDDARAGVHAGARAAPPRYGPASVSRYASINDTADAERLIVRIREGDEAAFDRLFRLCYGALADLAHRYVANTDEAEEVATDVLVWVWERRASLDIHGPVTGYLFRATRNRALNLRAAQRREPSLAARDDLPADAPADAPHPLLTIEAAELSAHARRVVDTLPPRAREIFLLSRRDGLSIRDVAATLGVTASTVQTQLARALRALRAALESG